jgi:hypothetical protein
VTLPFLGLDIRLRVREIDGNPGDPGQVTAGTTVKLCMGSDSATEGENSLAKVPAYVNLAKQAAADALGEEDEGPAAQAAFQAAIGGARSLGSSLANLGGLETQVSFYAFYYLHYQSKVVAYSHFAFLFPIAADGNVAAISHSTFARLRKVCSA